MKQLLAFPAPQQTLVTTMRYKVYYQWPPTSVAEPAPPGHCHFDRAGAHVSIGNWKFNAVNHNSLIKKLKTLTVEKYTLLKSLKHERTLNFVTISVNSLFFLYLLTVNSFKGIASWDFVVCFLVSFDSSEVSTPTEVVHLLIKFRFSCRNLRFSHLGVVSLLCE
jgi:hypothetical protein